MGCWPACCLVCVASASRVCVQRFIIQQVAPGHCVPRVQCLLHNPVFSLVSARHNLLRYFRYRVASVVGSRAATVCGVAASRHEIHLRCHAGWDGHAIHCKHRLLPEHLLVLRPRVVAVAHPRTARVEHQRAARCQVRLDTATTPIMHTATGCTVPVELRTATPLALAWMGCLRRVMVDVLVLAPASKDPRACSRRQGYHTHDAVLHSYNQHVVAHPPSATT